MNMATVIAAIALIIVVSLALRYIIREKKKGSKCVGCPYAGECTKYGGHGGQHVSGGHSGECGH